MGLHLHVFAGLGGRGKKRVWLNELITLSGRVKAPVVIGLIQALLQALNRETESMLDGSDTVADWPILNALVKQPGCKLGESPSWWWCGHGLQHSCGMVIVADGTGDAVRKGTDNITETILAWV